MRAGLLALTIVLLSAGSASAEWQIRPFFGVSFGGDTTLIDLAGAAGSPNPVIGATGALLGNVVGVEADFGFAPGFFQSGDQQLVRSNSVTMLTGNIILSAPRRRTRYTLGPYFVVGAGLLHAHVDDASDVLSVSSTLPAMDIGGGATGFLTDRIGLNWEARYFWSVGEGQVRGSSISPQEAAEQLSFWRASMGLVIRY
jgi:hypothetical protein